VLDYAVTRKVHVTRISGKFGKVDDPDGRMAVMDSMECHAVV
jgi:hypothetical protein